MFSFLLKLAIVILVVYAIAVRLRRSVYATNPWGLSGAPLWQDPGPSTPAFVNREFAVKGKPDFIYPEGDAEIAVEYKDRPSRIYDSDVIQAKAAALAARGSGRPIRAIVVATRTAHQRYNLPDADKDLHREIAEYINTARQAKMGQKMRALPNIFKCRSCAYSHKCRHSLG